MPSSPPPPPLSLLSPPHPTLLAEITSSPTGLSSVVEKIKLIKRIKVHVLYQPHYLQDVCGMHNTRQKLDRFFSWSNLIFYHPATAAAITGSSPPSPFNSFPPPIRAQPTWKDDEALASATTLKPQKQIPNFSIRGIMRLKKFLLLIFWFKPSSWRLTKDKLSTYELCWWTG